MSLDMNDQVEGTAFAGSTNTRLTRVELDVREIKSDVKAILARIDKAAGVAIGLSSLGLITGLAALWKAGP